MSRTLELPEAVYDALEQAAASRGLSPAAWIAANLGQSGAAPADQSAGTLAERFTGRLGRIRSGGQKRLSENCGEQFTEALVAKRQAGHL